MYLAKESFKFSSTHFTLFSPSEAERLHGHNYQVAVECEFQKLDALGMGFEFNTLKPHIKALTEAWDERVLIQSQSPYLKLIREDVRGEPHVTIDFANRSYRFPTADVVLLDTVNVTSEELARIFTLSLAKIWRQTLERAEHDSKELSNRILSLEVSIEETRGQRASFKLASPLTSSSQSAARLDLK